jgi:hypothetical protein
MDSTAWLLHAVRGQVGIRGLDPLQDHAALAALVDEQIERHRDRIGPVGAQERDGLRAAVMAEVWPNVISSASSCPRKPSMSS